MCIFPLIYGTACTYIETCVQDLSIIQQQIKENVDSDKPIKTEFKQFIRLNKDCYK